MDATRCRVRARMPHARAAPQGTQHFAPIAAGADTPSTLAITSATRTAASVRTAPQSQAPPAPATALLCATNARADTPSTPARPSARSAVNVRMETLPLALLVRPTDIPNALLATWATRSTLARQSASGARLADTCQLNPTSARIAQSATLLHQSARQSVCRVLVVLPTLRAARYVHRVETVNSSRRVGAVTVVKPVTRAKGQHPIELPAKIARPNKSGRVACASTASHLESGSTTRLA